MNLNFLYCYQYLRYWLLVEYWFKALICNNFGQLNEYSVVLYNFWIDVMSSFTFCLHTYANSCLSKNAFAIYTKFIFCFLFFADCFHCVIYIHIYMCVYVCIYVCILFDHLITCFAFRNNPCLFSWSFSFATAMLVIGKHLSFTLV